MKHYVYEIIDPRSGKVFYVGKGCKDRLKHHVRHVKNEHLSYKKKNPHKYNKINSILEDGYDDVKYKKPFITENSNEALKKEEKLISNYGLENLTNICPGGNGGYNPKVAKVNSELRSGSTWEEIYGEEKAKEMKKERSEQFSGKGNPFYGMTFEEIHGKEKADRLRKKFAKKAKETHMGRTRSEETKKKMSEAAKGIHTLEWYKKEYGEEKGKQKYEERIEKLSKAQAENWKDPEYREEMCKKLSEAQKKRWKRKGKKLSEEQLKESLEASNTIAAARRYAAKNYEEVSRPTFEKYIREYSLTDLKQEVLSIQGF